LTAGQGIAITDAGAGGAVTINNTRTGDSFPSYLVLLGTSSLPNARSIAQGFGIDFFDGGIGADFTIFVDNDEVATITGSRFTGPVLFAGGMSGSLQRLTTGETFIAGGFGVFVTTQSNGQIRLAIDPTQTGDPGAPFLTFAATASLSNERVLTVDTDLSVSTSSAGTFIIRNTAGFDRNITVPVVFLTGSLPNQRKLAVASGLTLTDFGAGNNITIGLEQFTSQSTHAYQGYCTGSLISGCRS